MYYMFMGTMQIPIPPATMRTRIKNRNRTISLINTGEINILKATGLTDITFKMLLPNTSYPFNQSILYGSSKASYYVDELERMKTSIDPFQFICVRMTDGGDLLNMTNIKVTLEDYAIEEDAQEGYDFYANISLKQYREWGAKKINVTTNQDGTKTGTKQGTRSIAGKAATPSRIVAKKNDTLQTICKKYLGNVAMSLPIVKKLNKIAVPAVLAVDQVIKLKAEENKQRNGGIITNGGIINGTILH